MYKASGQRSHDKDWYSLGVKVGKVLHVRARPVDHHRMIRILAVAGEKDAVGKTNIVANSAFARTKLPKSAPVMGANLGLENLDSPLRLTSRDILAQFFLGFQNLGEIISARVNFSANGDFTKG